MADSCMLFISVTCASGVEDIDAWGMRACTTMDKLAQSYPEQYRAFTKDSFAKMDDGSGVVVCHATVPVAFKDIYTDTLLNACGDDGVIGTCIACIDPDSQNDYMADMDALRTFKSESSTLGDGAADAPEPELSWLTTIINGDGRAARSRLACAYSMFILFLDTQFDFAEDIKRFLATQRAPQN